jgi:hypothetical protein
MVESNCVYKFQFQKPKGRDNSGDLNIVGIAVIKWILKGIGRRKKCRLHPSVSGQSSGGL